jgi:hypothetical protein
MYCGGEMGEIISREVFDYLLDHMLDIHRKKISIISPYTQDYDSYMTKLNFLNSYIRGIESFLESASVESGKNELPFVILGSIVEVRQTGTNKSFRIRIMLPKETALPDSGSDQIHTCFSDLGHAMLLKRVGDQIEAVPHIPNYLITNILADRSVKSGKRI